MHPNCCQLIAEFILLHQDLKLGMDALHKANLDFDTLLHVLILAQDRTTLWSLMQTCHSLYVAGSPHLLSYPIHLKTRDDLGSFCKWMLPRSDEERYLRLFRQIYIYMETVSSNENQELSEILAEILRRATSLEELSIELPADLNDLAFGSSVLREAIQDLTIRSLRVKHAGHRMVEFLSTVRSPLVFLDVHFLFSPRRSPFNPLPSMRNLASTLTHLTIVNAHPILEQALKFPLVRVLIISSRFPTLSLPWIHTFPNVTHLTYRLSADEAMCTPHSDRIRVNSRSQIRHIQDWAQLSRVQGGPGALYSLGLQCQVHELVVDPIGDVGWNQLSSVLSDYQPEIIRLNIRPEVQICDASWIIQNVLEPSTRLSHLEIRILRDLDDSKLRSLMVKLVVASTLIL